MKRIIFLLIASIIVILGLYFIISPIINKFTGVTTVTGVWGETIRIYPGCELTYDGECSDIGMGTHTINLGGPPGLCIRKGMHKCKKVDDKCQLIQSEESEKCYKEDK